MKHLDPKKDLPSPAIILAILSRTAVYPKCSRECYRKISASCWIFIQGDHITDGREGCQYGTIRFNGETWRVHRTMWEFFNQMKIPKNLVLRHKCDRPRCFNPDHLESGTNRQNVNDFNRRVRNAAKGKANGAYTKPENRPKGERVVELEINEDIAGQIKGCLEIVGTDPDAIVSIAVHFRVTPYVVQQAASGEIWRNVKAVQPAALPKILTIPSDLL